MDSDTQGKVSRMVCPVCERGCLLGESNMGACGLYEQRGGRIAETLADHYLAVGPISIETMPMLHYYPGHKFLQISTTGCNFDCPGCISTVIVREMPRHSKALKRISPAQVVEQAASQGCKGIAFLMNDPLASLPTFLRVAALAKERGLKVGCSSNGYFTSQSLESILPVLDFINIGLKGFSDRAYRACGAGAGMRPVLRNLERLWAAGVHVELSVMFTKDSEPELLALGRRLAGIDPAMPLQLMRFIPFEGADQASEPSVRQAEDFCRRMRSVLKHVYLFNTPGTENLHTLCPSCGRPELRREFYGPMGSKLMGDPPAEPRTPVCGACGGSLDITGTRASLAHQEEAFQGGYPFTRALEMVEAMLIAMGVKSKKDIVRAWEHLLERDGLHQLHHDVQKPQSYIRAVRHFGGLVGADKKAGELAGYLEEKLAMASRDLQGAENLPGVYYAMAKPLFYLGGGRMENQLVECAGGVSLNRKLPKGGRPGRCISVEQLNRLNPDIIFISAFLSNTVEDFLKECLELGVTAPAVKRKQVFAHPAPGWDFGSPRWILGLMNMARIFHPERCAYDVMAEARAFYRRFYQMEFSPQDVNRSFAKPSGIWRWPGRKKTDAPDRPLPHTSSAAS